MRHLRESLPDHRNIQRLIRVGTKHPGEIIRLDPSQHHIAVGHTQRPLVAVTGRPRAGAGRLRAHPVSGAIELQDRAATGGHGMDSHHRRTHANARDLGIESTLELTGIMADIGRGAAHIESDQFIETGRGRGLDHTNHATGRT